MKTLDIVKKQTGYPQILSKCATAQRGKSCDLNQSSYWKLPFGAEFFFVEYKFIGRHTFVRTFLVSF
jgi:hypothetical protein